MKTPATVIANYISSQIPLPWSSMHPLNKKYNVKILLAISLIPLFFFLTPSLTKLQTNAVQCK